jgi:hypothetical protein
MTAIGNKVQTEPLGEIESLLPWHAAGTLGARDARRVDAALAADPELVRQYAAIREECAETIVLNESLGTPSSRVMHRLFAAIDAEPVRGAPAAFDVSARVTGFFARLSPRVTAAAAAVAVLALLVQASVIGVMVMRRPTGSMEGAALAKAERQLADGRTFALVRFTPEAKVSEIAAFLGTYQASIVDVAKGGMFRLQFGDKPLSADELAKLLGRLQNEKIFSLVVAAQ